MGDSDSAGFDCSPAAELDAEAGAAFGRDAVDSLLQGLVGGGFGGECFGLGGSATGR